MRRTQLSADVLSDIFLGMEGGIDGAFIVAQVCAYWRSTAFSTPLLWSTLNIRKDNTRRVPKTLVLSQDVPLSLELLFIVPSVIEVLIPHYHRITALSITYGDNDCAFLQPLLCAGVELPALQQLKASAEWRNRRLGCDVSLAAPALRTLVLNGVALDDWKQLFTPTVTNVQLLEQYWPVDNGAAQPGLLLQDCTNLERLVVDGHYYLQLEVGNFSQQEKPLYCLNHVELRTDESTAWDILRLVPSDVVVQEMDIGMADLDVHSTDIARGKLAAIFRGMAPVTEFSYNIEILSLLELRDAHGRIRRMRPRNEFRMVEWCWPETWVELAAYGLCHTLEIIRIRAGYWNHLAGALRQRPLGLQKVDIHVILKSDVPDADDFSDWDDETAASGGPLRLRCNGIQKLIFEDDGNSTYQSKQCLPRSYMVHAYISAVDSTSPSIAICVSNAGMEKDEEPISLETFRKQLTGNRVLCQHCVSLLT